ncbi:hypothetical protein VNO77_24288 [Canavalia gladiata]|uniref:Uncharacterized protein n=1 Tax=Canavalia gladiata TaxID=3824 RepID=A0AAN9L5Z9_CANGL
MKYVAFSKKRPKGLEQAFHACEKLVMKEQSQSSLENNQVNKPPHQSTLDSNISPKNSVHRVLPVLASFI